MLPFFLINDALSEQPLCRVKELGDDIYKEFLTHNKKINKWEIMDYVINDNHIKKAEKCFRNWSIKKLNQSKNLTFPDHREKIKETNLFYSPASNFGYAKVSIYKKQTQIFFKESFYIDYKGRVYANELFYMKFNKFNKPDFYAFSYNNDKINKRNAYCLRCHNERVNYGYLFKKY